MTQAIAILMKTPLFGGLPPAQLEAVAGIARIASHEKGSSIFSQGEPPDGFHVVVSGQVRVLKHAPDGKEQILHVFGPGEPFGEVAVFMGRPFPASAEAMQPTSTLFFPRAAFVALIEGDPALALNIIAVLSQRLLQFTALVENLALREVPGRLAGYLARLAGEQGDDTVTLGMPKGQLANLLGATPETLSRLLSRLTRDGIIQSISHKRIRILDWEALRLMAGGDDTE